MLDLHRRALGRSVELVDLVRDDQWDLPTPCTAWTLRQLVTHMIQENRGFAAAAGGETVDRSPWTDPVGADLRGGYAESAERVVAAFNADGVLDRAFWLPLISDTMTFPARQAISFHLLDYVVHGWDVAAAVGYPLVIDDDLVAVTIDIAEKEVPDTPRRERPDASFRPPIHVPLEASAQERMLAMLGRPPHWPD
jgi:uncharacterized protein (TIGR03086 family)